MSFRNCIQGKINEGKIDKDKGEKLIAKFERKVEQFKVQGTGELAAQKAAEDLLNSEALNMELKARNLRNHALKQQEVNARMNRNSSKQEKVVGDILQNAAFRAQGVEKEAYALINQIADKLKVDFNGLGRNYETVVNGIRSLLGGAVDDAEAVKVGEVMKQSFDYLHGRLRQAGGIIGKLDNYFPQMHSKEAILNSKIGKEGWVQYITPLLDRAKIIDDSTGMPFRDRKLTEVLGGVYDSIITAGRSDMAKMSTEGEIIPRRKTDLDMRNSQERFIHFKDADAFLEYNNKFGVGDNGLASAFLNKIKSLSRDIGIMEHMGPKPDAIMRFMDYKLGAENDNPLRRKWLNAQYRVLAGKLEAGNIDSVWWKAFTGTHNLLRSALLGSAPVSAMTDSALLAATAKINGLDSVKVLGDYLKHILPFESEGKQIAKRSGFIAEALGGSALQDTRFAGESQSGSGFMHSLAQATHKWSGLAHMTVAAQDAVSLEGMAHLAENMHAGTAWGDLHPDLREKLGHFGFDEADWGDLKKANIVDNGQAKFLITSELRTDPNLTAIRAKQLADKLDDWTMYLRQAATSEPLLATKALTSGAILGDGGAATPSRVVGASLGLFKSFPLTVMLSHTLPAFERARVDRKFDHLAMVTIGATLLGAAAMQTREFVKGKTPKDMDNYKFWSAAFLQGGGMGLFGDFFLGDYSRFDRNPITEALGPGVGLFEDIYKATKGNLDGWATSRDGDAADIPKNVAGDLFRVAKRNIPLGSLWYGRLALERLVLDNLERMIDPGFDRRMGKYERKIKKETGQEFWWSPR